ncbi:hypothetical protein FQR65_LT16460 [Abscondita terminalis]|nr:hypothetical protein FQR65_LT16460 [Abscondita terminalis]
MENIENILFDFNIEKDDYELYGKNIAKINASNFKDFARKGKLIVMTSINPTPAGEGKTTTAIGLTDGLNFIGKDAILALREPSLGPVFGRKGTATGGGKSQVIPNDEINLHFTDLNDRSLRSVDIKITNQISRKEHFNITAASNMMTILSLAKDEQDLRKRIESSLVGMTNSSKPVFAKDLKVVGSVMAILKNAIKPNFVRTQYDSPVLVHCGPFANIAIGTNSIISTDLALKLGEYAVIETGFGSDLGFEKFMNLVNYQYDLVPDCVVLVVTVRALELQNDFKNNFEHLKQHLEHINLYKLNLVIAINKIEGDDELKLKSLKAFLTSRGYN